MNVAIVTSAVGPAARDDIDIRASNQSRSLPAASRNTALEVTSDVSA